MARLETQKPTVIFNAGDKIPPDLSQRAFASLFIPTEGKRIGKPAVTYSSAYELEAAVRHVARWYGFTTRSDGRVIICACSKTSKVVKREKEQSKELSSLLGMPIENECTKRRNRVAVSSVACPFRISYSRIKGQGNLPKAEAEVHVTNVNFSHSHELSAEMLVKQSKACYQYTIPPHVCRTIVGLMASGPVSVMTLRNYYQSQLPPGTSVTSMMIVNLRMKCRLLEMQYGETSAVPTEQLARVFDPSSLEVAPQSWNDDPVMKGILHDCLVDAWTGDPRDQEFAIGKVLRLLKEECAHGFDYRIYYNSEGRPEGLVTMTPSQRYNHIRYGSVCAQDAQEKTRNTYGWRYSSVSGKNNEYRLVNFCDAMMLAEKDDFQVFMFVEIHVMSGRPLWDLKVLNTDNKLSEEYFRSNVHG